MVAVEGDWTKKCGAPEWDESRSCGAREPSSQISIDFRNKEITSNKTLSSESFKKPNVKAIIGQNWDYCICHINLDNILIKFDSSHDLWFFLKFSKFETSSKWNFGVRKSGVYFFQVKPYDGGAKILSQNNGKKVSVSKNWLWSLLS